MGGPPGTQLNGLPVNHQLCPPQTCHIVGLWVSRGAPMAPRPAGATGKWRQITISTLPVVLPRLPDRLSTARDLVAVGHAPNRGLQRPSKT
eukprot:2057603-Lingulodinium_polyedra.AAC.1